MPSSDIRTLLNESGVRWFFGSFVRNLLNTSLLAWLILLDISCGACKRCGLWKAVRQLIQKKNNLDNLQKRGLLSATELIIFEMAVMALLILPKHAILLSVTGELYPSSASVSLIPILSFMLLSSSIYFGLISGTIHGYMDTVSAVLNGGRNLKIILCFYVLVIELIAISKYIFIT